jgi:alkanesulfonate monooxygenase SsuD/methylene tetrahydromethanopterin reductase-like flavin-dependent oxidoreductase (luciferase family)
MNQASILVRRDGSGRENKDMQIGTAADAAGPEDAQLVRDAERLGVSSVWVAEA